MGKIISYYIPSRITAEEAFYNYGTKVQATPTILVLAEDKTELLRPIPGLPKSGVEFVNYLSVGLQAMQATSKCKK